MQVTRTQTWKMALSVSAAVMAGLMTSVASAGVTHTADANSLLLWHLDETAFNTAPGGTDAADASVNGFNGTAFNDVATVAVGATGITGGVSDKAFDFLGRDTAIRNMVRATNINSVAAGGDFTVELWFNVSDFSTMAGALSDATTGSILANQRATVFAWNLGIRPDASGNTAFQFFQNKGTTNNHATAAQALNANTWYYVAMTGDAAGNYNIYLAEQGAASLTLVDSFVAAASVVDASTNGFHIGGTENAPELRTFDGLIDEVQYSNIVRDQAYLEDAAGIIPEPASLALLGAGSVLMLARKRN